MPAAANRGNPKFSIYISDETGRSNSYQCLLPTKLSKEESLELRIEMKQRIINLATMMAMVTIEWY